MTSAETPSDSLEPGLYIVAVPIGNLGDITLRAVDVLKRCDIVACEDTRVAGKLLKHLGLRKKLWRYDDHSDEEARERLVAMAGQQAIALTSDAGTPIVSDPGFRLVRSMQDAGVFVTSLPGACAAVTALTLSGLPNDRFLFAGFLPNREKARSETLADLAQIDATLIFYETAPRLVASLTAIADLMGDRTVAVARELTKLHEECRRGTAVSLAEHYREKPPRGEIVLLVAPPSERAIDDDETDRLLVEAMRELKPSKAAAQVAKESGRDRKALYARALELKE
ncbi:16S rRNA (cytidine(1402)-2'-O)-methyltransferase [Altererythrobacter aurantiacus]|uniref:Ribosomal RNA small subunit methyltransferase I n=1 Tax=Parapontixanthobacter aurantiacus TaxID=1463599 RepID=A0A844ZHU0_9SPHN|nr:16S rRNA (cytidine(1402)-2'-O)-methyltransferase [Parapontixanthobacter aurantiacus]